MKVLLINGSPHEKGCTYTALNETAKAMEGEGINTEIVWLGTKPIASCISCGLCGKIGNCAINDIVNDVIEKIDETDGFIFGSPVHYAAASGSMTAFMGRLFYSASSAMRGKPAACVVSCRRAGSTAALDQLNKFPMLAGMPLATSQYWNMVHGNTPDEVRKDKEGLQIMRTLGRNMAWLIKCIDEGKKHGINYPVRESGVSTNFIRRDQTV